MTMLRDTLIGGLLALACLFGLPAAADSGAPPLTVAITDAAPPFAYRDAQGELAGFNVDVAREICRRLGRPCRFVPHLFPDLLPAVAAGRADLGAGNYLKTPERERQVQFTIAYWRSTSSFIGANTIALPPLKEIPAYHRLCVTRDTRQQEFMSRIAGERTSAILVTDTNQEAFEHLIAGHCSLLLLPTLQGLSLLQSTPGKGYAFLGPALSQEGLGGDVHMIVKPGDAALLQAVDAALRGMIADGTHARLARKYFPFDIL